MLIDGFFQDLSTYRGRVAVIDEKGAETTYEALVAETLAWEKRLVELAVQAGDVVALEGDYTTPIIACFWALARRRCIILPMTAHTPAHDEAYQELAEVRHRLSFDTQGAWKHETRETPRQHPLLQQLRASGEPGMVLFTSGSEGAAKIILHSVNKLLSKYLKPLVPARTLLFLVFDHIAGLDKMLYVLSAGGTCVREPTRRPDAAANAIERYKVENLPSTPSFLNLLLVSGACEGRDLSCVKVVTYGSETMPENLLARLRKVMPQAQFINKFGTTELGSALSTSKSSDSVWLKFDPRQYQVRVVDGMFWVKSTTAMLGYLNAPSPFDKDGYMSTGDLVELDGEWMRFLGRRSEMINVGGEKVHPAEVEAVLSQMPGVKQVSVWGEPSPILGQMVVARIALAAEKPLDDVKRDVRAFCKGRLAAHQIPSRILLGAEDQHNYRFKKMRREAASK